MNAEFWDSRYAEEELAYGSEANAYLRQQYSRFFADSAATSALCLAEGQGRNALYLATAGNVPYVVAVDYSAQGMKTLESLAAEQNVSDRIHTKVQDLTAYHLLQDALPGSEGYEVIISIFAHTPPPIRKVLHQQLASALQSGGYFILEAYTPANIGCGTGGPQVADLCMTKAQLLEEVVGLELLECEEKEVEVNEGKYHSGLAAVVIATFRKP